MAWCAHPGEPPPRGASTFSLTLPGEFSPTGLSALPQTVAASSSATECGCTYVEGCLPAARVGVPVRTRTRPHPNPPRPGCAPRRRTARSTRSRSGASTGIDSERLLDDRRTDGRGAASQFLGAELEIGGRGGVDDRLRPAGPGDRDDVVAERELPRQHHPLRADVVRGADPREDVEALSDGPRATTGTTERAPRQERDQLRSSFMENGIAPRPIAETVNGPRDLVFTPGSLPRARHCPSHLNIDERAGGTRDLDHLEEPVADLPIDDPHLPPAVAGST